MVDLSKNEQFLYLDPLLIKLSLIMLTADNSSYVFMVNKQKDNEYDQELRILNKELVENWFNRYRIEKIKRGESRNKELVELGFYSILDEL